MSNAKLGKGIYHTHFCGWIENIQPHHDLPQVCCSLVVSTSLEKNKIIFYFTGGLRFNSIDTFGLKNYLIEILKLLSMSLKIDYNLHLENPFCYGREILA